MQEIQANIQVHCDQSLGELKRIWSSIGYDEINWTYTERGKYLLRKLSDISHKPYYIRNHNAFTSGNCLSWPAWGSTNVYHEMPDGSVHYDWTIVDRVYDTYVENRFKPLIELGFMPYDLTSAPKDEGGWFNDLGQENYESKGWWKYPPKDYDEWGALVYNFVKHLVERYGSDEVASWYFELWNEPNLPNYWMGTAKEYCRLYDASVSAAIRALPKIRIGGPAIAHPGFDMMRTFLTRFLEHCANTGQKLDFISFHTKGAIYNPRRIYNPHLPIEKLNPSSSQMMSDINAALEEIARFPQFKNIPVLIDECDPAVGTIYGVYDNPNFVITNSEHYPNFICALTKRILDLQEKFENPIEFFTSWAFYFEGKRFFEGNRALMTNMNVEKPILNGFRALEYMSGTRLRVVSNQARDVLTNGHPSVEVDALASIDEHTIAVLIWHQTDPWWVAGEASIKLQIHGFPFCGEAEITHYRIDSDHSNTYSAWLKQGKPDIPTPEQLLEITSQQGLYEMDRIQILSLENEIIELDFDLPLFGILLLIIEPTNNSNRN